jgi:hypothetical protein
VTAVAALTLAVCSGAAARLPATDKAGCLKHLPGQHLRRDQCAMLLHAGREYDFPNGRLRHWTAYTLSGQRLYPQWYPGGRADLYTVRNPNNTYRSYARYANVLGFPMFEVHRPMALLVPRSIALSNPV